MIRKIELNEAGKIDHIYCRFDDIEEDPNPNGLEVANDQGGLFDWLFLNMGIAKKIYTYVAGRFERCSDEEAMLIIAEYVDDEGLVLPPDYNVTPEGLAKVNPKKIDDLSAEELNEIAKPIPVPDDFPEIPENFVAVDAYKKLHGIEFKKNQVHQGVK